MAKQMMNREFSKFYGDQFGTLWIPLREQTSSGNENDNDTNLVFNFEDIDFKRIALPSVIDLTQEGEEEEHELEEEDPLSIWVEQNLLNTPTLTPINDTNDVDIERLDQIRIDDEMESTFLQEQAFPTSSSPEDQPAKSTGSNSKPRLRDSKNQSPKTVASTPKTTPEDQQAKSSED